jgi:hypothetical protein
VELAAGHERPVHEGEQREAGGEVAARVAGEAQHDRRGRGDEVPAEQHHRGRGAHIGRPMRDVEREREDEREHRPDRQAQHHRPDHRRFGHEEHAQESRQCGGGRGRELPAARPDAVRDRGHRERHEQAHRVEDREQ